MSTESDTTTSSASEGSDDSSASSLPKTHTDDAQDTEDESSIGETTTSPTRRAVWLATLVAMAYSLPVPALITAHSLGALDLSLIPQMWFLLYGAGVATSVTFALGIQNFFEGMFGGE